MKINGKLDMKRFHMSFGDKMIYIKTNNKIKYYHSQLKKIITDNKFADFKNLQYDYKFGYNNFDGYYKLYFEQYFYNLSFTSKIENEFIVDWIDTFINKYAWEYALNHRENNIKDWHYVDFDIVHWKELRDNHIEPQNNIIENTCWKYDLNYDDRKYVFEYEINTLKTANIIDSVYEEMIKQFTNKLNVGFENDYWIYNKDKMEFTIKL